MTKYVKKPIVVEAFQYGDDIPEWAIDRVKCIAPGQILVDTLEGKMIAYLGDFIIKGIKNEIYPCKSDIFHDTYSMVDD
jgi:hypothetical protein